MRAPLPAIAEPSFNPLIMKKLLVTSLLAIFAAVGFGQGLHVCLANNSVVDVKECDIDKIVATDRYIPAPDEGGYLFMFMTDARYGRMHYALSRDCYEWTTLNGGRVIDESYCGHPDICQGPDGTYCTISVDPFELWTSSDMVTWYKRPLSRSFIDAAALKGWFVTYYMGAPKMMYDADSGQFMITWHACRVNGKDDWDSMRTIYTLTSDFVTFTDPLPLFSFTGADADMAIIDCIIRRLGDRYYAIMKDERFADKSPNGKTIRIAFSSSLTGPYTNPSPAVTPTDKMREAPIFVERPDGNGCYLFAESYDTPPYRYEMFTAPSINSSFTFDPLFSCPSVGDGTSRPNARHGCIIPVSESTYAALLRAYGR